MVEGHEPLSKQDALLVAYIKDIYQDCELETVSHATFHDVTDSVADRAHVRISQEEAELNVLDDGRLIAGGRLQKPS